MTDQEAVVVRVKGLGEVDQLGPGSGEEEMCPAEGGLLVVEVADQAVPRALHHAHVELEVQDLGNQHEGFVL